MAKLSEIIKIIRASGGKFKRIKDRESWLNERKLGSSDASAIWGINKYRTPYKAWAELTGLIPKADLSEKEVVQWGNTLEPVIAAEFSKRTGFVIIHNKYLFTHKTLDYVTATPDYFVCIDGEWGILEIKNTGEHHKSDWEDGVPDHAQIQVNHQLMCCPGLSFAVVCGLIGGNKLKWRRFERDQELETMLVDRYRDFWELVETKTPPKLTSDDNEVIDGVYIRTEQKSEIEIEISQESLFTEYKAICKEIADLEKKKDELKANIKNLLKENTTGICGGYKATWELRHYKERYSPARDTPVLTITNLKNKKDGE